MPGIESAPPLAFLGLVGQAMEFIFSGAQSTTAGQAVGGLDQVRELTVNQFELTALALGLSLLLALPAGVLLGHRAGGEGLVPFIGNAGRALPELLVIALFVAFVPGDWLNIWGLGVALSILGIPPILTNAFVGVRQVDPGAVEAARGVGMTDIEIITKVELPLAAATIMGGVRTAAINIWATATIAPLAGFLTLGDFIISRNVYGDAGVLAGAILVAFFALLIEGALAGLQRLLTPRGLALQSA